MRGKLDDFEDAESELSTSNQCIQSSLRSRISFLSRLTKRTNVSIWQSPTSQWDMYILLLNRISNCFRTMQKSPSRQTNPTFLVLIHSVWYSSPRHGQCHSTRRSRPLWFRPCLNTKEFNGRWNALSIRPFSEPRKFKSLSGRKVLKLHWKNQQSLCGMFGKGCHCAPIIGRILFGVVMPLSYHLHQIVTALNWLVDSTIEYGSAWTFSTLLYKTSSKVGNRSVLSDVPTGSDPYLVRPIRLGLS